jgi:hypothetical protein
MHKEIIKSRAVNVDGRTAAKVARKPPSLCNEAQVHILRHTLRDRKPPIFKKVLGEREDSYSSAA